MKRAMAVAVAAATTWATPTVASDPAGDPFDLYEAAYAGTVPVEGTVVYPEGQEAAVCSPPDWAPLHPDRPDLTWPSIRRGVIEELGSVHPDAPRLTGPAFAAFNSSLLETEGGTLALTIWGGTTIPCGDDALSPGDVVVVGGLFDFDSTVCDDELQCPEAFARLSGFVEGGSPRAWSDLDIAVHAWSTPDEGCASVPAASTSLLALGLLLRRRRR